MTIDWTAFTPWSALAGGLLIGLASALFVLGNGRIAGIAGIVGSPLRALLAGAATSGSPLSLLLPIRQASLFRWCLDAGMRVVMPMTLMALGDYQEPAGSWFPSVFY